MSRAFTALVVIFELLLFFFGFLFGVVVRFDYETALNHPYVGIQALLMGFVIQAALFYNGLYDFKSVMVPRALFARLLVVLILTLLLLALLYFILPDLLVGRGVTLIAVGFNFAAFTLWRLFLGRYMRSRPLRRVLLMGNGEMAQELAQMVRDREGLGYRFVGYLHAAEPASGPSSLSGALPPQDSLAAVRVEAPATRLAPIDPAELVGTYDEVKEVARRTSADVVVVAMPDRRGNMPVNEMLDLKFSGVEIMEGVTLYEQFSEKIFIRDLKPSWMIFSEGFRRSDVRKVSKRILDVVASIFGIFVAGIPMLVTAMLVKLTSPGPSIYAQERVGEFGRVFTLYKFRSMRLDAESTGPQMAALVDQRVTRFGNFIRKTRLDELPQLFNVLRGDMSLVGPRPERPFFVIKLQREIPFFRQRLFVKPGLTGLAQVKFKYAEKAEDHVEKLQYDLAYIKNMGILYDIQIILETIKVMVFQRGAH